MYILYIENIQYIYILYIENTVIVAISDLCFTLRGSYYCGKCNFFTEKENNQQ